MTKKTRFVPYTRKTKKELKEIALGIVERQIFTDRHVSNPRDISLIFMPIALMDEQTAKWMDKCEINMVFEYIDKAGPRSINGCPIFWSMQMLDKHDAKIVLDLYDELIKARDKFIEN